MNKEEKETKQFSDKDILDWLEKQKGIGINHERYGEYSYYANDGFPSIRVTVSQILSGTHYTQKK